tara:strand:- start:291 stop:965 length:675 start_codon:yes stop_codon:yes gene_type:complete
MNEIFLDTETTGLSFRDGHRIVEIACLETRNLIPTKNIFHKLINPERDVPEDAVNIHGYTGVFLKKYEKFEKIADIFLNFIKDKKIIIHNAAFDVGFLNYELKLLKKDEIKKEQVIDSLEIARGKYPGSQNSLDALCKKFNIDLSKRTKHNALLDCELLREVYINLTDQKEPSLIFNEITNNFHRKDNLKKIKKNYSKLIVSPSEVEKERHKKFLKTEIKKNFF